MSWPTDAQRRDWFANNHETAPTEPDEPQPVDDPDTEPTR